MRRGFTVDVRVKTGKSKDQNLELGPTEGWAYREAVVETERFSRERNALSLVGVRKPFEGY